MRVRSKDPMVLVTAPVPTFESGVRITQVGGNDGGGNSGSNSGGNGGTDGGDPDIDIDDDVDDFNDTDTEDDDFGDAYNDTESNRGSRAAERFGRSEPRLTPPPPPWVHQRVVIDKVGNGTITGNVQGVFDWPLLGTRPLPLSTRFDLFSPNSHAPPHTHRTRTTAHAHDSYARAKHYRKSAGDGRGAVAGARRASAGGRAGLQRRRRGGAQGALARLLLLLLRGPAVVRLPLVLQPRRRQHHLMTSTTIATITITTIIITIFVPHVVHRFCNCRRRRVHKSFIKPGLRS
jgi:hypothetical protein